MHQGDLYGHLLINGQSPSAQMIARNARLELREITRGIKELESAGVLRRTEEGVIFSPRMVRDEQRRRDRAEGGQLGAEHGHKAADNPQASRPGEARGGGRPRKPGPYPDKEPPFEPPSDPATEPPLKPAPSSSSSSSISYDDDEKRTPESQLRKAGLTSSQIAKAASRGGEYLEQCAAFLAAPPDGVKPLAIIGACIRDGSDPPAVSAPLLPAEAETFSKWRREHANANRDAMRRRNIETSDPRYEPTLLAEFRRGAGALSRTGSPTESSA